MKSKTKPAKISSTPVQDEKYLSVKNFLTVEEDDNDLDIVSNLNSMYQWNCGEEFWKWNLLGTEAEIEILADKLLHSGSQLLRSQDDSNHL